jgi:hypothetical protein
MFGFVKSVISKIFSDDEKKRCTAMTEDGLCNRKMYGRGCVNGEEIKYCKRHVPSQAMIAGGRWDPVEFEVSDGTLEVK